MQQYGLAVAGLLMHGQCRESLGRIPMLARRVALDHREKPTGDRSAERSEGCRVVIDDPAHQRDRPLLVAVPPLQRRPFDEPWYRLPPEPIDFPR